MVTTGSNGKSNKFKVAAAHSAPVYMNKDATLQKVVEVVEQAGREGIKLLVFPRLMFPGILTLSKPVLLTPSAGPGSLRGQSVVVVSGGGGRSEDEKEEAEQDDDDLAQIKAACRRTGVSISLGISERMKGGYTLFNSQVTIDGTTGKILGVHRKLQPTFVERIVWAQGTGSTLQTHPMPGLNGFNLGGLACWEHTMNLARQALIGENQHLHAAAWPALSTMSGFEAVADAQIEALMKSHALTAQVFVICASNYVDRACLDWIEQNVGKQDLVKEGGGWSAVIHPFCSVLGGDGEGGPCTGAGERLVSAEIDLDDLKVVKVWLDAAGHYARPEILSMRVDRNKYWQDERSGGKEWWKGKGKGEGEDVEDNDK